MDLAKDLEKELETTAQEVLGKLRSGELFQSNWDTAAFIIFLIFLGECGPGLWPLAPPWPPVLGLAEGLIWTPIPPPGTVLLLLLLVCLHCCCHSCCSRRASRPRKVSPGKVRPASGGSSLELHCGEGVAGAPVERGQLGTHEESPASPVLLLQEHRRGVDNLALEP